jgi:prephenate dehydratase/chorismate mutase
MDLENLRSKIDQADRELLDVLRRRMELSIRTRAFKKAIAAEDREKQILETVERASNGILAPEFSKALYQAILGESRRLQTSEVKLVGFQGEHGAYSELAVSRLYSKACAIPLSDFSDVFEGVQSGSLDSGVVPVENSLAGNVTQVDDLMIETSLKIIGEIILPVHHCLIALPDMDYRDIRMVYSHPQALGQCRGFLSRNKLEARPYYDTAGAAKMLAHERPAATAVIASRLAADLYGLEVLKESIEDADTNSTRFLVLAREESKEAGDKCSIVFSTAHKPGALFAALSVFSESGINLSRIESRPVPKSPGLYAFLLDFLGSKDDQAVKAALKKLSEEAVSLKILGFYKRAV